MTIRQQELTNNPIPLLLEGVPEGQGSNIKQLP
jgi:hypothetical protein